MKCSKSVIVLLFIVIQLFAQAQQPSGKAKDYRKLHYLSEEEMNTPVRTNVNFIETPPPVGPVRMVAEFEPMQSVLIRYQFGIPYQLIREMAEDIQVITLVSSQAQATTVQNLYISNNVNVANCSFLIAATDSYWTRDYGPWFVFDGNNQPGIVDFPYNRPRPNDNNVPPKVAQHLGINLFGMNVKHTGGNMMADGLGMAASTELVYEEETQTPTQINAKMLNYLGIERYDVMNDPLGDYIKHIDCWGKYLAPDKILLGQVAPSDPRFSDYEAVANYFATTPSSYGYPYKVYRVYSPGGNPTTPYTNSLILNHKVFVPLSGGQWDDEALAVYEEAMPGYEIIGVPYSGWENTDALHCRTHEIADLGMLFMDHRPLYGNLDWADSVQVTAKIIPYSGQEVIADSLRIHYSINNGPYQTTNLTTSLGSSYTGYIKQYGEMDTIRYYLSAADASGRSIRHPYMGALDPHVFVTGSQPFNQLVIQPDTMYFISEAHNSFTIYNLTPASFDINEVTSNFEFMQSIELPSLPITLAPGDSLVVEVVIYILVSHSYQPNAFVEGTIHVVSTIGEADVVMMVNEQLISALDETENQNAVVYPNPFTTQLFLRLPEGSKGNSEVKIYSSTGQLVFEQSFTTFESEFSIKWDGKSLDGNRLPEGVYFYHLHNGDKTYSGKMVYDQP